MDIKKESTKNAFSLLELLITLAVIAIMMGLGTYALVSFQYYTQTQNVYSDVSTLLRTQRNKAQNGSYSQAKFEKTGKIEDSVPDYYGIIVYNRREYAPVYCDEINTAVGFDCQVESESILTTTVSVIRDQCVGVLFKTYTGEVFRFNSNSIFSTGTCTITISHDQSNDQRVITINADDNVIEY